MGLLLTLFLVIIVYKRMPTKNQALVFLLTILMGISAFGYWVELTSTTKEAALNGVKIGYMGKVYLLFIMMLVTGQLTKVKLRAWMKILMFTVASVTLGVVMLCDRYPWFYSSITYVQEGDFAHLALGHGIFYKIYALYLFVGMLGSMGMCVYGYLREDEPSRRRQIVYFFTCILAQILGFLLFLSGATHGYDPSALFNIISAALLLRITLKYNLVNTLSAAKDQVLDEIGTGVVIVDGDNRFLYANRTAKEIYPHLSEENYVDAVEDVIHHADKEEAKLSGVKVYSINEQNIYNTAVSHGKVFVMNDVTVSYYYTQTLSKEVDEKTKELQDMQKSMEKYYFQVISALSSAVEAKDRYTRGHSLRVATYAKELSKRMGMSEEKQREIYYAGLLHDIGKIRVSDSIINKDGKLTDNEFEDVKIHTVTGYYILKNVSAIYDLSSAARWHHERYDGTGYPDGLKGEDIPLIARIICVADSYDAMASTRSYRRELSQEVVRGEINKGKGRQFDPKIADVMLQMIDEDKEYKMRQFNSEQRNILLVDDNEENLKELRNMLAEQEEYKLHDAKTIKEAQREILSREIDAVVVNIDCLFMDGYQVIKTVRTYSNVPVLVLTANKDMGIIRKAMDLGARDYLIKPILAKTLLETIHNVLHQVAAYSEDEETEEGRDESVKADQEQEKNAETGDVIPDKQDGKAAEKIIETKQSEVKTPEPEKPEVKVPEAKQPEVKESEIRQPEVKVPEAKQPEVKESEIRQPEVKVPRRRRSRKYDSRK